MTDKAKGKDVVSSISVSEQQATLEKTLHARAHTAFGRRIAGHKIIEHLGPIFSFQKSEMKAFGGKVLQQFEGEMDRGLVYLLEKAKSRGGDAVINLQFRELTDFRNYIMSGDVVRLEPV